jgi:glycosyltransferase involved in cell wall biosynthesis
MGKERVFLLGFPGLIGGANTEAFDTLKLWRANGLPVAVIPTWEMPDLDSPRYRDIVELGCEVIASGPDDRLLRTEGLPGSIVVAFCNQRFLLHAGVFRKLGCRIVWVGCMNWLFKQERLHYREHGPFHWYVFQSQYQQDKILPRLQSYDFDRSRCTLIRGAFDPQPWIGLPPRPHIPGEAFIIGRISRPDPDKFPRDLWAQYDRINSPKLARVLGFDFESQDHHCGPPPRWVETIKPGGEPVDEFLRSIHCLCPGTGAVAVENWPRVGLEAMAAGVPVIAEDRGGWREMLPADCLAKDHLHQGHLLSRLAWNEELRRSVISSNRLRVGDNLRTANVGSWQKWAGIFEELRR